MTGIALLCLACTYVAGVNHERLTWREAAQTRDVLLARASEAARTESCRTLTVQDAPDNISGVHLFHVGLKEALATIPTSTDPAARVCTFQWTGTSLRVVSAAP